MKVIICSQKPAKIGAVVIAFANLGINARIKSVNAQSFVSEQPTFDETTVGAQNRAAHAQILEPGADLYISMENGIMRSANGFHYVDKACILVIGKDGREHMGFSEEIPIPYESLKAVRSLGLAKHTLAEVLLEQGIIQKLDDPYPGMEGRTRADLLSDALTGILSEKLKWIVKTQTGVSQDVKISDIAI